MKKTLIALASVAALGAAHADVTLYGVIDAAVGTSSSALSSDANNPSNANVLAATGQSIFNSTAGRVTGMANGLLQPSRWGLKGTENLGGGLKGMFTLESGLNIAGGTNPNDHALLAGNTGTTGAGDSSLNGQMFDREASIGLAGDFGQIQAGFQLNLNGELLGRADPLGGGYISPMGTYGGLTGMGSSYTGRASNSFKYKYSMGNTELAAFYAMGGYTGNAGQGSQTGISAKIAATPTIEINLAASRMNDNVSFTSGAQAAASSTAAAAAGGGSAGLPGLAATYYNSTETILSANWQATPTFKLKVGYLTETQSNPSNGAGDALVTANNGIPIAGNTLNTSPFGTNLTTTMSWLGGTYDITPTQHLSAAYYQKGVNSYTKNYASAGAIANAYAAFSFNYAAGTTSILGLVYDIDLSKQSDVYFAANFQKFDSQGTATQACVSAAATTTNQAQVCSATNNGATLSQWGALAGESISYLGVGYRMKF